MKIKFAHLINQIRSTFWVIPAFSILLAITVAATLLFLDQRHSEWVEMQAPWLKEISAAGTTTLLGTVANSVLGLAGITFSGTLVALTLASSQFGPRLLRNFIQANTTQATLGVLLATHVYCLYVMRNVRGGDIEFVPHIATFGAFILTLISLGMFILFIQHVVASIQAEKVTAAVYQELSRSIDRFFGEHSRDDDEESRQREEEDWENCDEDEVLTQKGAGYLQACNIEQLVLIAAERDLRCRVLLEPGSFVVDGGELLAWKGSRSLSSEDQGRLRDCFLMGWERTAEQDLEHCVRQLVEVALRALSPSVNDPFTAMNCIDYLGAALVDVARRQLPPSVFRDGKGEARVRTKPATFSSFLEVACSQICEAGSAKPEVSLRILKMLRVVAQQCCSQSQLDAVLAQARFVAKADRSQAVAEQDKERIREIYDELEALCEA